MFLQVVLHDPELDFLSNAIIRQMAQFEKFGRYVHPDICMKLQGLFSVYQRRAGNLLYNLNLYGTHGVGKSEHTVSFCNNLFIPGTFTTLDRMTNAADQTDVSVEDQIRGQHEMEEAFVNEKHGRRHADKVNMKKSALTSGILTLASMEIRKIPGLGQIRVPTMHRQAQNYTEVNSSNSMPDENAIGSRYHNCLLTESSIPVEQMYYEVLSDHKKQFWTDYRVCQFLTAWMEKTMETFAIPCRSPYLALAYDISVRMIAYMKAHKLIDGNVNMRRLEIIMNAIRVRTLQKAAILTWHTKGAPHYGEQFEPRQLEDAAPVMYADSSIILFVGISTRRNSSRRIGAMCCTPCGC